MPLCGNSIPFSLDQFFGADLEIEVMSHKLMKLMFLIKFSPMRSSVNYSLLKLSTLSIMIKSLTKDWTTHISQNTELVQLDFSTSIATQQLDFINSEMSNPEL